jgi:chaperonin cofactor prefoldin
MKSKVLFFWITAAVVVISIFFMQRCKLLEYKDTAQIQAVELSTLKDSVRVIRQKNGELSYQVKAVEVEKRNLRQSLEVAGYEIKDLKAQEIKWRKITSTLRAELESKGSGQAEIVRDTIHENRTDTIFQNNFKWNNDYLFLSGNVNRDFVNFDYRYRTALDIVTFEKKRETVVSVSLDDPNASVVSSSSITISHKRKWYEKPWIWGLAGFTTGIIISR